VLDIYISRLNAKSDMANEYTKDELMAMKTWDAKLTSLVLNLDTMQNLSYLWEECSVSRWLSNTVTFSSMVIFPCPCHCPSRHCSSSRHHFSCNPSPPVQVPGARPFNCGSAQSPHVGTL
jgi:hypothetical protein